MDNHTTQVRRQTRWNPSTCFKLFFLHITRFSFTPKVTNGHIFFQPHQMSIQMETTVVISWQTLTLLRLISSWFGK